MTIIPIAFRPSVPWPSTFSSKKKIEDDMTANAPFHHPFLRKKKSSTTPKPQTPTNSQHKPTENIPKSTPKTPQKRQPKKKFFTLSENPLSIPPR
jgi:hypothetical protein